MTTNTYPAIYLELAEGLVTVELYWDYTRRTCENLVTAILEKAWEGKRMSRNGLLLSTSAEAAIGPIVADSPPCELSHSGAGLLTCSIVDEGAWSITLAPLPALDSHSVIVGRVATGMGVLVRAAMGSGPVIRSMRIDDLPRRPRPTNKGIQGLGH